MGMRQRGRSLSIGTKTLLSHMILCVAIIVLAGVLSYAITSQYMKETRLKELLVKADRIAEIERTKPPDELRRYTARMYEGLTNAKVFFLEADTETIRMSRYAQKKSDTYARATESESLQWFDIRDTSDRDYARRVLAGERVSAMKHFEFAQDEIIFAGAPILDDDGVVCGGVVLAQPGAELHSLSRMVRYMVVFVMSVSLLLSVILAMQFTRMLVRPIQRITRAARRMENGVYAERITQLPGDEIGELGHALNSMSGRLMDVIRSIRKERDKLELVISGIGEGLVAVDTGWHIVHANAAFLELMELDSAAGLLAEGERASQFAPLRDLLARCMDSGEALTLEWVNASHRALHADATALLDETGVILGTVCMIRDVSEAQRLEQLRRDYVANISHELRTPLTGIRGMVEPLIDGCMDTEEERLESYRIILQETVRLEKLVGEMLDMSRLQDGRMKVELEPMELPGILEAAERNMRPIADEAGVALSVETDGSKLACLGNEDRIMQVLVILLDNALSFTPQGGQVVIFAREEENCVCVGVRDNGCGIEPKDLPLIWERFYKADKSRMRTTGTGLGLSIAKLVVQLMGGDITVESEPGAGATFTFTLKKT